MVDSDGIEFGPRSAHKRWLIVRAATDIFLRNGYLGTSMDQIAAYAHVSKMTLYKHFSDKDTLFIEIVTRTVEDISDLVLKEIVALADTDSLETDLRDLARRQLTRVMQTQLLQLRRLVIAEAGRFPQLGRQFYELGPGRTVTSLATTFERLAERGLLKQGDPTVAASHFNWLVMSAPMNRAMLLGEDEPPPPKEIKRYADEGVAAFLAAYGAR